MSLLRKRILPMLTILVVACAQVFGMQRGFVCDHHGATVVTDAEHCHHEKEAGKTGFAACSEDAHKDDSEHEDTEHHAPLTLDLQASASGLATVTIPAFVAVLVAENPVHEWVLIHTPTVNEMMMTPRDSGRESPPPAALQVARCMVILI